MILQEFKEFISRGNVIDLAVAVVMGAAFTSIVNSVVRDILMPLLGILLGGINFGNLSITIGDAVIKYGSFLQAVINFLIISAVVFVLVKIIYKIEKHLLNRDLKKKQTALEVLIDIRTLLEKKNV